MIKNLLTLVKVTVVMLVILLSANQKTYASHAMGGQLTYQALGGDSFLVILNFYYFCNNSYGPMPATVQVNTYSPTCNVSNIATTLRMDSAESFLDVTPVCPNDTPSYCENHNSIYPGVWQYVYKGIVVLTDTCSNWITYFTMTGRNQNITTLSPSQQPLTVFCLINNTVQPNNSPAFGALPIPFICNGQTFCYNNGSTDPDGDSLAYEMMTPLQGTALDNPFVPVTYTSSVYDSIAPIDSSPPIVFDSTNGTVCMTPSALDVGVMAILVKKFRHGVLIGEVERDIQITVVNCIGSTPTLSGIGQDSAQAFASNIFEDTVCSQVPFSFHVYCADSSSAYIDTMWWNGTISGATFTVTPGPRPIGTFTWIPPSSATNSINYCFTVTVKNNACPYEGITTQAYCIRVVGADVGFRHSNTCNTVVTFTDTSTIPAGTITGWHWYFNDTASFALDSSILQNPVHTFSDTGWYNVRLVTTSSWGCNDTAAELIHVRVGQLISASSTNATCSYLSNGTGQVIIISGGITPFQYIWSNGDTTSSIVNLGPGIYIVSVTDSVGCEKQDTVTVTAPPALQSNNSQHNIYCHDAPNAGAAFTDVTGGTGAYHYVWSPSVSTTGTATSLTQGNYFVTITDANGCTLTALFPITHQNSLGADSFQTNVKCFGTNTGWAAVHVFSEHETYTYVWTNTTSIDSFASNLSTGTYSVVITDSSAQPCRDTVHFTITSPTKIRTVFDSATKIPCHGELSIAFVADTGGVGGYTYSWSTSPVQTAATATGLTAGSYSVTITDTNHCAVDTMITISQPAKLDSAHSHSNVLCFGESTGSATETPSGGTTGYTFAWTPSGGNSANATGLAAGIYTVVVTDADGCTTIDTVLITQPPLLTLTLNAVPLTQTLCDGFTATLTSQGNGGTPGDTYSWTASSGGFTSSDSVVTVTPNTTTTYTIQITDQDGCTHDTSVTITVNANPVPTLSDSGVCYGLTPIEWVNNPQTGWTYQWDNPTVGTSDTLRVNTFVNHIDSVFVRDANGCVSGWILDSAIIDGPEVLASFYADSLIGYQPLYDLFHSTSQYSDRYFWNFGDSLSGPFDTISFNPYDSIASHIFDSAGTYKIMLVAENQYGCKDTAYRTITVESISHLIVYNVFTPNGDGKNDEWFPDYTHMSGAHVEIFNRWGLKIKDMYGLSGWDGTNSGGSLCPDGTYYYILFATGVDGVDYHQHGFITLMK